VNTPTFETIQASIQACYQAGDFTGALALADRYAGEYPEHAHLFAYWQMCMAARLDNLPRALSVLESALDGGFWYGETLLRKSPSLQPLQGIPAFEDLVQRNRQQEAATRQEAFPLVTIRPRSACTQRDDPCPLLLGLHANAARAQTSLPYWQPAAFEGWLVAAPESVQAMWRGAYIWDDLEITSQQIQRHFHALQENYALDHELILLAGHSMGAEAALWLALKRALPARAVLLVGPGGPLTSEPSAWQELIQEYWQQKDAEEDALRIAFILGQADETIPHQEIGLLIAMLEEAGFETRLDIVPAAGHDYQDEYLPAIRHALEFFRHPTG
jgi:predicted esterase